MDLIIFGGQSNMQGQTEGLPADNTPIENAFEYRWAEHLLAPLRHPVGENIDTQGKPFLPDFNDIPGTLEKSALLAAWENHSNMVPAFCKSYIAAAGRAVAAVHTAKGSTAIDYWLKGGMGYTYLVKKAAAAIKLVRPEHIFFVWLQGESDALEGTSKEVYKEKIILLNTALKNSLSIEKFGVVLVGAFTGDARDRHIADAQKEVCAENDDFLLLTSITEKLTKAPQFMNPFVSGHYSTLGQECIGTDAGKTLGQYALSAPAKAVGLQKKASDNSPLH